MNLYGLDKNKNEILFTHDHTQARSLGGNNEQNNTQTMCLEGNFKKSKLEQILVESKNEKIIETAKKIYKNL